MYSSHLFLYRRFKFNANGPTLYTRQPHFTKVHTRHPLRHTNPNVFCNVSDVELKVFLALLDLLDRTFSINLSLKILDQRYYINNIFLKSLVRKECLNLREGLPRPGTGFGLSPLLCGKERTHSALFSFKIWESTKTSCCSFSADIKGKSLPNFTKKKLTFGNFSINSCVPCVS